MASTTFKASFVIRDIFRTDDVEEFRSYLSKYDPNTIYNKADFETPAFPVGLAIFYNAKGIFDLLLSDPRTNVNKTDRYFFGRFLAMAIRYINPYFVEELLKRGADVNFEFDKDQENNALGIAIGHDVFRQHDTHEMEKIALTEIVEILIRYKADVNKSCNINNERPLHKATYTGYMPIINVLIQTPGIDLDVKDKKGLTPLMNSIINHHFAAFLELITAGANVNILSYDIDSALSYALLDSDFYFKNENRNIVREIVRILLISMEKKILNTGNYMGRTPLCLASSYFDEWIVNILVNNGSNVNHQDRTGSTPLMKAATMRHLEKVEILISAGADANLLSNNQESALSYVLMNYTHYTNEKDRNIIRSIVNILLLYTNINTLNTGNKRCGYTPLHIAAMYYDYWMIKKLLKKGANKLVIDKDGNTPSWLAFEAGKTREAELILQYEFDDST